MKKVLVAVAIVGLMVSPVWANNVHIGNTTNNTTNNAGGQGGQGGNASSSASATGGTHVQTNTQINSQTSVNTNVNTQGQQQGQGQHQGQAQGQDQRQQANNEGNKQSTKINVESSLIPGVAVAPGLTSGGSQVCLGSFSVGLSGPMAGVAFGKTVVDEGCEDRQHAILLFNMGYQAQALELLKGNGRVKALFEVKAAGVAEKQAASIPEAIQQTQQTRVESVQGN